MSIAYSSIEADRDIKKMRILIEQIAAGEPAALATAKRILQGTGMYTKTGNLKKKFRI